MHRSTSRAAFLATLALIALVLAACGSSASSPAATSAPTTAPAQSAAAPSTGGGGGGSGNAVTIQNFAFNPSTIEVPVGATVTWTNQDTAGHTVTADDGSFDSKTLATGATFQQTFSTAGTFTYHCSIHSSMKATITVK